MNLLSEDHIVRFLTAFCRRHDNFDDYYLIFEWADGGNLDDLWKKDERPTLNAELVRDSIEQLHGLACALSAAHAFHRSKSFRHGDLRPTNILRFQHAGSIIGKLKIGNWREDNNHQLHTELIFNPTVNSQTPRYEAPEAAAGVNPILLDQSTKRRSRFNDIWAIGCITLEFMIWLLHGRTGLEEFEKQFHKDSPSFYQIDPEDPHRATLHPVVNAYMESMANDPRCAKGAALGRLLEIIKTGLLVVKLPQLTGTMRPRHENAPTGLTNIEAASPSVPSVYISGLDTVEPEPPGPERIRANKLQQLIEDILSKEDPDDEFWLPSSRLSAGSTFPTFLASHETDHAEKRIPIRGASTPDIEKSEFSSIQIRHNVLFSVFLHSSVDHD